MSTETEIDRLLVRLVGDATSYQRMLNEAQTGIKKTADVTEREGKRIERFAASLRTFGQGVRGAGAAMSLAITTPLLAISGAASHASMSFEQSLQRLRSLVGLSADEISTFRGEVLQLSDATGKAPLELVATYEAITSGGLKGSAAMEALTISAKASSIGMGDAATIGRTASLAMTAYGVANLSASNAVDILRAAAEAGNAEASEFAPVMGRLLPTAQTLGLEFEEVAGTIAFMTRMTGDASQAATGFAGIMAKLQGAGLSPKVLEKIGGMDGLRRMQKVFADQGIVKGIEYLMTTLKKANVEVLDFMSDREGLVALQMLTGQSAEDFKDVLETTANSVGQVDARFKEWEETMGAKMAKAMAGTQAMMIKLGDMLAPIVQKLTQWGLSAMEVWNMLTPEMQKVTVTVLAVVAAVGPLLVGFGTMAIMLSSVVSGFAALSAAITFLAPLTPIILGVVAAIAAIGTALYALRGPIMEVFNDLKKYFSETLMGLTEALKAGDFQLAWEIVMTQIKLSFLQVITDMTMHLLGFLDLISMVNPALAVVRDQVAKGAINLGIATFTTQLKLGNLNTDAYEKALQAIYGKDAEAAAAAAAAAGGGGGPAATAFKEGKYYASEGVQATTVGSAEAMARVSAYRSLSEGSAAERTAKGVEEVVGILEQIRDMGGGLSPAALAESA